MAEEPANQPLPAATPEQAQQAANSLTGDAPPEDMGGDVAIAAGFAAHAGALEAMVALPEEQQTALGAQASEAVSAAVGLTPTEDQAVAISQAAAALGDTAAQPITPDELAAVAEWGEGDGAGDGHIVARATLFVAQLGADGIAALAEGAPELAAGLVKSAAWTLGAFAATPALAPLAVGVGALAFSSAMGAVTVGTTAAALGVGSAAVAGLWKWRADTLMGLEQQSKAADGPSPLAFPFHHRGLYSSQRICWFQRDCTGFHDPIG